MRSLSTSVELAKEDAQKARKECELERLQARKAADDVNRLLDQKKSETHQVQMTLQAREEDLRTSASNSRRREESLQVIFVENTENNCKQDELQAANTCLAVRRRELREEREKWQSERLELLQRMQTLKNGPSGAMSSPHVCLFVLMSVLF